VCISRDQDDLVARKVLEIEGPRHRASSTKAVPSTPTGRAPRPDRGCLLNGNRNPELSREQIELALREIGRERRYLAGTGCGQRRNWRACR
jgi:agmatine/peptidylarginine deiminase